MENQTNSKMACKNIEAEPEDWATTPDTPASKRNPKREEKFN